ncbi:hypothetical protein GJAV_G00024480 [Gymnothorax javanicus]|nr:hypothetical protein GJAV_G00024480 [Gymnothorax javanicus]
MWCLLSIEWHNIIAKGVASFSTAGGHKMALLRTEDKTVTDRLTNLFDDRNIAFNQPAEWPPRSPDLTPLDFLLWGHLKLKVCITPPRDLDDLVRHIRAEVNILRQERGTVGTRRLKLHRDRSDNNSFILSSTSLRAILPEGHYLAKRRGGEGLSRGIWVACERRLRLLSERRNKLATNLQNTADSGGPARACGIVTHQKSVGILHGGSPCSPAVSCLRSWATEEVFLTLVRQPGCNPHPR